MVFFTCNACGSCVKKPAAEKHIYQCRAFSSLSCMDCNKDFYGDEYKAHTKCVSELEKYSGEGWKAPTGHNKGEKKQGAWMDTVLATVEKAGKNASPSVKSLLNSLTKHDNVPRKKAKFMNFICNITKNHFDNGTIENVWTMLETQWKSEKPEVQKVEKKEEQTAQPAEDERLLEAEDADLVHKKSKKHKKITKCVSELEKYSEGGCEAPAEHNNKSEKKQAWMDAVLDTAENASKNASPSVKSLLNSLTKHDNVPRRKLKFMNFISDIAENDFDNETTESVWTMLEAQWKSKKSEVLKVEKEDEETAQPLDDERLLEAEETEPVRKKSKKHKKN